MLENTFQTLNNVHNKPTELSTVFFGFFFFFVFFFSDIAYGVAVRTPSNLNVVQN